MTTASEMTVSTFGEFTAHARQLIDETLDTLLPRDNESPVSVHQAMRWSVFAGGKRFRPLLLMAAGEAFGAGESVLSRIAAAFELVHTYSLIHDDLPSMDDDDLRRGKPTCHIKFGEATAILAGDGLQTLAFQTIAETEELPLSIRVQLIRELSRAAGTPGGMVAGQALDLEAEARNVSSGSKPETQQIGDSELEQIHRCKTGALIIAAARCGAIIAGASAAELDVISEYAAQLGLLFQITDDLLDVTATAEDIGKTPGKDARSLKATYPGLYGVDAARERAQETYARACAALDRLNEIDSQPVNNPSSATIQSQPTALKARSTRQLAALAEYILNRNA
jgi:geranylgeranyl pyrophosphate synthase